MSGTLAERKSASPSIPLVSPRELMPYALFGGLVLMLLVYFVGAESSALSVLNGTFVHEFVHDARHLLGFPCH